MFCLIYMPASQKFSVNNQKGVAHILVILILLIGLAAGYYLVNYTKTNLKPKAYVSSPVGGGIFDLVGKGSCADVPGKQKIAVSWITSKTPQFKSYEPDLKAVNEKGDITGSIGGLKCLGANSNYFEFPGTYSSQGIYRVIVSGFTGPNCDSPDGDIKSEGVDITNDACSTPIPIIIRVMPAATQSQLYT